MRALLLAGGLGTRLRPLTDNVPKCLVEIGGVALLDYWLELLFRAGVERALINTHWLAGSVEAHIARSPWRSRVDLVHEETLLGTGGTVLANRSYFRGAPFLVAHADNLTNFDPAALKGAHDAARPDCAITMLAFDTDAPTSCGVLELDARGRVIAFHEKVAHPPGNLANGAAYIFEPEVLDFMSGLDRNVIDLSTEIIPHYLGRILAVKTTGYHRDIGTLESLERARREFVPSDFGRSPPNIMPAGEHS